MVTILIYFISILFQEKGGQIQYSLAVPTDLGPKPNEPDNSVMELAELVSKMMKRFKVQ